MTKSGIVIVFIISSVMGLAWAGMEMNQRNFHTEFTCPEERPIGDVRPTENECIYMYI